MNKPELPYQIKIATPCPARWEDMGGDDRIRFCDHCQKNVYNLSAMTTRDATALLESKSGNLCARIYQRKDGTVLTEDCPVGVARYWGRLKALAAGGVAAILLGCATAFAIADDRDKDSDNEESRIVTVAQNASDKVKKWLGIKPAAQPTLPTRVTMGMVCVSTPAPKPVQPMLGKVRIAPNPPAPTPPAK
jgi:hypothetical protein